MGYKKLNVIKAGMIMSKKAKKEETEEEAPEKTEAEGGGEEGEGGEGAPKKGKKKLILVAAALLVVLIGAGLFFSGVLGGGEKGEGHETAKELTEEEKAAEAEANLPVYYELPQFLVNLSSSSAGRASFLKMSVTLELRDKAAVAVMDANKPRVMDAFNTYLRELRPADIQGSAGIYRLRVELMSRLNGTIQDGIVKDILFGEIIVQ